VKLIAVCFAFVGAFAPSARSAQEIIPPAPIHYFNDDAGLVSQSVAEQFDRQLAQFERETSNQVVVAIFPKMQSDDDIAAYTQRVAESWGVGQKDKRNGIVLFVFVEDRKMIIQVGYGLEGALPDATAFNITEYQMKPRFIAGDYEGGLRNGIESILSATRGEYKGSDETAPEPRPKRSAMWPLLFLAFFLVLSLVAGIHRVTPRGHVISSAGRHWTLDWHDVLFFWMNLLLSMSVRGGGDSGSSSGRFRGGGGSFGGGGAGSSW
jgi:uncharacterized protein